MDRQFLTIRRATPLGRNIRCVAFVASAALVTAMMAQGIRIRLNVLDTWHYVAPVEDIGKDRMWELLQNDEFKFIATVTFLVSPTGSNQTFNIPFTWNNFNNKVESIGGGASGGAHSGNFSNCSTGGGGGAYSFVSNLVLTQGGTATYQIASTAAAVLNSSNGNAGNSTWFNATTFGASSVGAVGGSAGQTQSTGGTCPGAAGGAAGSCIGTATSGGASGTATNSARSSSASGGGGAAGPNGVGLASANVTDGASTGGTGDNGSGGTGGAGSTGSTGNNGNNGAEYDASHGLGGGGGGGSTTGDTISASAGNGGNYGAGGGGASASGNSTGATSGIGAQGLIVVTTVPTTRSFMLSAVVG